VRRIYTVIFIGSHRKFIGRYRTDRRVPGNGWLARFLVQWDLRESMREANIEVILQRAKEKYPEAKPLREALQQRPPEQCHRLHHTEGRAGRTPAGNSRRPGSEIRSGERTPEKSPPAGRVIDETDFFQVADNP
jgi:hypothetical protein